MSILDGILGPATTAATDAVSGYDAGKISASERLLQTLGIESQLQQRGAEANAANARANFYRSRTPALDILRQKMIDAGNDPDDVEAAIASGDPATIRGLMRPDPTQTHAANRDYDVAHPLPSRASAGPRVNPNAEPPAQRDARRAAAATMANIRQTRQQIAGVQRQQQNAIVPSDSAGTGAQLRQLNQRADSLQNAYDQQSRAAQGTAPSGAPPQASAAPSLSPDDSTAMQQEFAEAANNYNAIVNSQAPLPVKQRARALYDQQNRAIALKYQRRIRR